MSNDHPTKGQLTREKILHTARDLFYIHGFHNTTSRMISEVSDTNLGLLNYYFKSKNEIGRLVYTDIRDTFDDLIAKNEPEMSDEDLFLFSSALELYLCITNATYGNFYHEFIAEPNNRSNVQQHISDVLMKHRGTDGMDDYTKLATLSISAIKPAVVSYALAHPDEIDTDTYLRYYLEQQLHFLERVKEDADYFIDLIHSYHISVAQRFTPILIKLNS